MDQDDDLPLIAPAWVERVRDTIARLEQRAAQGERYAQLALVGWKQERARLERGEIY